MPKEESRKKFINPLTQPSTVPVTETETNMPTLPATEPSTMPQTAASTLPDTSPSTASDTQAETYTSAEEEWEYRKTGKEAFEKTHKRVTWWLPKTLEKRFNAFARKSSQRKVALVKEAITDLLEKHEKPKEPTPWPAYLAEKEQEVLSLRKLVRDAAGMLEQVRQHGENAHLPLYEIDAWMNRKREILREYLEVEGKEDEEAQTEPGPG